MEVLFSDEEQDWRCQVVEWCGCIRWKEPTLRYLLIPTERRTGHLFTSQDFTTLRLQSGHRLSKMPRSSEGAF